MTQGRFVRKPATAAAALLTATLAASCSHPAALAPPPTDPFLLRLRTLRLRVETRAGEIALQEECDGISRSMTVADVATLERYAASSEAKPFSFLWARLLVQRERYDMAARVIVSALADEPENREYRLWKWWAVSFKERPDYKQMTQRLDSGFLKEFATGPEARRLVVAQLFGKGAAEARLSVEEFKASFPADAWEGAE